MRYCSLDAEATLACRRLNQNARATTTPRGFPLPGDTVHHAPDRLADVRNIRIEVSFDVAAGRLFGRCTTTLSPVNDGLEWLSFDAVDFAIRAVEVGPVGKTRKPAAYDYDGKELRINLGRNRRSSDVLEVIVAYEAEPRRGLYFNRPDAGYPQRRVEIWTQGQDEDSRHWFPCHDFPNEKTTSEVLATVPEHFTAISNGCLIAEYHDRDARTRTFHWRQDQPHVSYLVSLVAGEFAELRHEADGIPVVYYVPPGREADGERSLGNTPEMLRFYNREIGYRYPWDKYAQVTVGDFIFGGMENTSATTLTDTCLFDERAALDYTSDPLVAHELAHQWFGDLLTCNEWAHGWLNEGFATYFEALWTEHHLGRDEFHWEMLQNAELYLGEDSSRYRRPLVERTYNEPIDLFDRHLYEKGSLVLHMLRGILGDALWRKSIAYYVRRHAFGNVVTLDLQRAVFEATGRNLEWFFDQWAYRGGHPEFAFTYSWVEADKLARLTVVQKQETDATTPLFRVPLDVDFYDQAGKPTRRRIEVTRKEEAFVFALPFQPAAVIVDPEGWMLYTGEFEKPKEMWEHILRHCPTIKPRIRAVEGLCANGAPSAVALVRETLLNDPFWGVRARAARALGKLRSDTARDALLAALESEHPKVRRAVVQALGEFRDTTVVDALLARLERGDPSYFVEAATASALGASRDPRALSALEQALERPSFRDVIRAGAFEGMASLHDQAAVPTVLDWTTYGRPPAAREAAVKALASLGKKDGLVRDDVLDRLTLLLHDPWLRVRIQAAQALGKIGDRRAVAPLQEYVRRELDGRGVRAGREAIEAIRASTPDEEVGKLRREVDDLVAENRKLRDRLDRLEARLHTNGAAVTPNRAKAKAKGKK